MHLKLSTNNSNNLWLATETTNHGMRKLNTRYASVICIYAYIVKDNKYFKNDYRWL